MHTHDPYTDTIAAAYVALGTRRALILSDRTVLPLCRHENSLMVYDDGVVLLLDNHELSGLDIVDYGAATPPLDFTRRPLGLDDHRERLEALAVLCAMRLELDIGYLKPGASEPETRLLSVISWSDGDRFSAPDLTRGAPRTFRVDRTAWIALSKRAPRIPVWSPKDGAYVLGRKQTPMWEVTP